MHAVRQRHEREEGPVILCNGVCSIFAEAVLDFRTSRTAQHSGRVSENPTDMIDHERIRTIAQDDKQIYAVQYGLLTSRDGSQ